MHNPFNWLWFAVALLCGLVSWRSCDRTPEVRYVDRVVTRMVPIEQIRVQARVDTVLEIRKIRVREDSILLESKIREIDSLTDIVRHYAAEHGDSVERIFQADTVACHEIGCDTIMVQFLSLANVFRVHLAPAPRKVKLVEQTIFVEKEVMPASAKVEWAGYGFLLGALGAYFATRSQ